MKHFKIRVIVCLLIAAACAAVFSHVKSPHKAVPLPQEAYVWQRSWTPAVHDAVTTAAPDLAAFVVLGAEGSFRSDGLQIARVSPDYAALTHTHRRIGVAFRIGPYRDLGKSSDAYTGELCGVAKSILSDAVAGGVHPAELQIDFDCADSRLESYRRWVRAIRQAVAPVSVTITALPSWLKQSSFVALAHDSDGYVLQVHSLERPTSIDSSLTLCDSGAALRAVEAAGRLGVPFRVALPTYGYVVAFDDRGDFAGLSAEGPSASWPESALVHDLRADPAAMAALVSHWSASRPACMSGIIWYRLPTTDDTLNWRWTTLRSVMRGVAPQPLLRAIVTEAEPQVIDVELVNDGQADAPLASQVCVRTRSPAVAADAIGGFEQRIDGGQVTFRPAASIDGQAIAPGGVRRIGWVRLSREEKVDAYVSTSQP
jgi:hypothetical protein